MSAPEDRLRRITALMDRAETYLTQMQEADGTPYDVAEALYFAALSEMLQELRALRMDGTLDVLQSFLETWTTRH